MCLAEIKDSLDRDFDILIYVDFGTRVVSAPHLDHPLEANFGRLGFDITSIFLIKCQ